MNESSPSLSGDTRSSGPGAAGRSARLAVTAIFLVNGLLFGTWVSRIPSVQTTVDLGSAELGLCLFMFAAGAFVAMPTTGIVLSSVAASRVTGVAAVGFCLSLVLIPIATTLAALAVFLFLFGITSGALDVAMNALAVIVERARQQVVMASFHASFSIGTVVGALAGGLAGGHDVTVRSHFLVVGLTGMVVLAAVRRSFPPDLGDVRDTTSSLSLALLGRGVFAIGVVAFIVLMFEGAVADWSAVYLAHDLGAVGGMAASGYAAFSSFMAAGRLLGDKVVRRFGSVRVVRAGALCAVIGLGAALLVTSPVAAVVGFAGAGAGLSVIFPIAVTAAGKQESVPAGVAIASISTLGYTGLLAGPAIIGAVAELITLRGALGLLLALLMIVVVMARAMRGDND